MFVECTYTRLIQSEANPAHIEKALSCSGYLKHMNVAKKTIYVVSTTENYHCSQAVIGQLCIVPYRLLANSIMSTIINSSCTSADSFLII